MCKITTTQNKKFKLNKKQQAILNEFITYIKENKNYQQNTYKRYKTILKKYIYTNKINTKKQLKQTLIENPPPVGKQVLGEYLGIRIIRKPSEFKNSHGYILIHNDTQLQQFITERNLKKATRDGYTSSLYRYLNVCGFNNTTEMIQEALEDEKKRIPVKESRLQQHLREYLRSLREAPDLKSSHTVHTYYTKVESFYRHFDITLPHRPPLTIKNQHNITYDDLPTHEMIKTAINQSTLEVASIIYFMTSSGTARTETFNLTVDKFLGGLKQYTTSTDPQTIVEELKERKDLVPVFSMFRQKTSIPYYTCCSPEATYHILQYMYAEKRYNREQILWKTTRDNIYKLFENINDKNNWGTVGFYRRFRTHALRKFHASNLGAPFDLINTLEGRSNGTIHETYVKTKPELIQKEYMKYMHNVMIHPELYETQQQPPAQKIKQQQHNTSTPTVIEPTPVITEQTKIVTGVDNTTLIKQIQELTKQVGILEYRIEQLEKK